MRLYRDSHKGGYDHTPEIVTGQVTLDYDDLRQPIKRHFETGMRDSDTIRFVNADGFWVTRRREPEQCLPST